MSCHSQRNDRLDHAVHFFKVILESSLRDGELMIPRSFVSKYWQGLSNPAVLQLPNGSEWKVNWIKRDGDVWFRNGWKIFAEYLSLDQAQFLVFRYEGNSHFQVVIFHRNALEIDYPLLRGTDEGEEVEENDNSLEILSDSSPCQGKRTKSPVTSSQTPKKMKTNPKEEPECYSSPHAETKGAQSKKTRHGKKKCHAAFGTSKPKIGGIRRALGRESIRRARARAETFRSENPSFLCTLSSTYTTRDILAMPRKFSAAYLHKMEGSDILLVNRERTWKAKLRLSSRRRQLVIHSGWKTFFADNNLKLGDSLAFELNKCKGLSLRVVIYRAAEESSTPQFQERGCDRSPKKCPKVEVFADQEGLSHRPSSSLRSSPETPKASSKYMSENHFTLFFKRTQLLHCTNIPFDFIKRYITDNGTHVTLQLQKRSWDVKVLYYSNYCYAKFSAGWPEFVRDCNLKEGDACRFELIDKKNLVFEVSILSLN